MASSNTLSMRPEGSERRHIEIAGSEWTLLHAIRARDDPVDVDGKTLSIADVVAVCMYNQYAALTEDPTVVENVERSIECLQAHVDSGKTIYGVNTGFGGSANARTTDVKSLQSALLQHQNSGILIPSDRGQKQSVLPDQAKVSLRSHALPVSIVRAMMLIRCNSLMRGHSGVRVSTITSILKLLESGMTPVVPLRGSISASGDLMPLSYIAGAIEGNPDIVIRLDRGIEDPIYMPANEALESIGLEPTRLIAKEGLGIVNGTAASCGAACIAIHQAHQIAVLTQVLTAMGTEALLGTWDNYHPFISESRPHRGQSEAAATIRAFLKKSKLATTHDEETHVPKVGLAQDRYALRTAPQWIGPQLEDLILATRQVEQEINSTTDNPLIDVQRNLIHHGGNFQAVSITSAMEKTMSVIQMFGRLLYAQCSELINSTLNKGLPANLSTADPSLSYTFKGIDINMSAYMSELAYLAHPVSTFVQAAEMQNQPVNSLALIAARNTLEAIEAVSLMQAAYLYALCQAIDLRCLHLEFVKAAKTRFSDLFSDVFQSLLPDGRISSPASKSWEAVEKKWNELSDLDLVERGKTAAKASLGYVLEFLFLEGKVGDNSPASTSVTPSMLEVYQNEVADMLITTYDSTRKSFCEQQTSPTYISAMSKEIYVLLRKELKVPMHRGLEDHPTLETVGVRGSLGKSSTNRKMLGTHASEIYMALRNGRIHDRVMGFLQRSGGVDQLAKGEVSAAVRRESKL